MRNLFFITLFFPLLNLLAAEGADCPNNSFPIDEFQSLVTSLRPLSPGKNTAIPILGDSLNPVAKIHGETLIPASLLEEYSTGGGGNYFSNIVDATENTLKKIDEELSKAKNSENKESRHIATLKAEKELFIKFNGFLDRKNKNLNVTKLVIKEFNRTGSIFFPPFKKEFIDKILLYIQKNIQKNYKTNNPETEDSEETDEEWAYGELEYKIKGMINEPDPIITYFRDEQKKSGLSLKDVKPIFESVPGKEEKVPFYSSAQILVANEYNPSTLEIVSSLVKKPETIKKTSSYAYKEGMEGERELLAQKLVSLTGFDKYLVRKKQVDLPEGVNLQSCSLYIMNERPVVDRGVPTLFQDEKTQKIYCLVDKKINELQNLKFGEGPLKDLNPTANATKVNHETCLKITEIPGCAPEKKPTIAVASVWLEGDEIINKEWLDYQKLKNLKANRELTENEEMLLFDFEQKYKKKMKKRDVQAHELLGLTFQTFDSHTQQYKILKSSDPSKPSKLRDYDFSRFGSGNIAWKKGDQTYILFRGNLMDHPYADEKIDEKLRERILSMDAKKISEESTKQGLVWDQGEYQDMLNDVKSGDQKKLDSVRLKSFNRLSPKAFGEMLRVIYSMQTELRENPSATPKDLFWASHPELKSFRKILEMNSTEGVFENIGLKRVGKIELASLEERIEAAEKMVGSKFTQEEIDQMKKDLKKININAVTSDEVALSALIH